MNTSHPKPDDLSDFERSAFEAFLATPGVVGTECYRHNDNGLLFLSAWRDSADYQGYYFWVVVSPPIASIADLSALQTNIKIKVEWDLDDAKQRMIARGATLAEANSALDGYPVTVEIIAKTVTGLALCLLPEWSATK